MKCLTTAPKYDPKIGPNVCVMCGSRLPTPINKFSIHLPRRICKKCK